MFDISTFLTTDTVVNVFWLAIIRTILGFLENVFELIKDGKLTADEKQQFLQTVWKVVTMYDWKNLAITYARLLPQGAAWSAVGLMPLALVSDKAYTALKNSSTPNSK